MRKAKVFVHGKEAGQLEEITRGKEYVFRYRDDYDGYPVSLTMPVAKREFRYDKFPPFFDGVLPEGFMLDGLLRRQKIDKDDLFSQLMAVGKDLVGATIAIANPVEELALPLAGKKRNLSRSLFFDYYAKERLALNDAVIHDVTATFSNALGDWDDLIDRSFLSDRMKDKYHFLLAARRETLAL